ncbi:alanine racemase [Anaerocolumna jejuensis DSM 15929]|uniref:Alanine racemase n=1 Tax=Anaerocolumna jejuensis DSM 15929 TaxID=1121322 RepID=A0A1M6MX23_9FIRM|nr:alanine racemase [Anaerocolumna jejuensis]SHJ88025.1 alanine racemase [Anaerocolumna jejuensis DSM 15929]
MTAGNIDLTSIEEFHSKYYRASANIDLDAICSNINNTRKLLEAKTRLMVILKADGYGHGAVPIAKALSDMAVDCFGVAILEEGIELRKAGIDKPILVLGYTPKGQYQKLVEYDITQTIFQYNTAKELSEEALRQGKTAKIHIKIDTGMSRIGFFDDTDSIEEVKKIAELKGIEIEGIFSHFACADEEDKTSANRQLKKFLDFTEELDKEGIHIPIKHIANSAAIIDIPEARLDMVRSGISTYGLYPSEDVKKDAIALKPAMEIKSHVSYVKEVETGVGVSYGSTYVTGRKTKIATIPVGYGDGYPRQLSSKGRVLIHGMSAPIIGRVCMDQFMVDVTDIPDVNQGDMVTLIGRDKDEFISVEEVANMSYSFNYEFICNVGKRIPRIYYRNNKVWNIGI